MTTSTTTDQPATIWFVDDHPTRMLYAGRRWRVSDRPTRLRASVWEVAHGGHMSGWRFQATDEVGESYVFDVFADPDGWHVHRSYT
ncbi:MULTISPECIES: hypothetical protein [unclassified Microbacterium]|uniref:hypothetical protein n=1 Tax=unclassified Microbacterium TaxID=2609290 RepID=UPI0030193560